MDTEDKNTQDDEFSFDWKKNGVGVKEHLTLKNDVKEAQKYADNKKSPSTSKKNINPETLPLGLKKLRKKIHGYNVHPNAVISSCSLHPAKEVSAVRSAAAQTTEDCSTPLPADGRVFFRHRFSATVQRQVPPILLRKKRQNLCIYHRDSGF